MRSTMFITVQIPMGDLRPFIAGATGRLPRPRWLNPQYERDFVRGVGVVRRRRRGGVRPWPAEQTYCGAAPLVRFPEPLWNGFARGGHPALRSMQFAGRRLFANGQAVWRVEISVANARARPSLAAGDLLDALRWLSRMPVDVRGDHKRRPLDDAGLAIARALLRATTRRLVDPQLWWLRAGEPLVLAQFAEAEVGTPFMHPWPADLDLPGIRPSFARLGDRATWLIAVAPGADPDAVRRLRVHLMRVHAERAALALVLDALADGSLARPGDPGFETLERYLQRADGFLRRKRVYGHPQPDLLRVAYGYDDIVSEGVRETLLEHLADAQEATRRAVDSLTAVSFPIA